MIVLMAGLPGTGKSTLARAIAERTGGVVLDKDVIRAALFPPGDIEYTPVQDDFCTHVMFETARYLLAKDPERCVVFDGRTFSHRYQIEQAVEEAGKIGTGWLIVECVCREETARRRIQEDVNTGRHPARNRTTALYDRLKREFDPIEQPKLVVDTDRPLEECVGLISFGDRRQKPGAGSQDGPSVV